MNKHLKLAINAIKEQYHATETSFRGDYSVLFDPAYLLDACTTLRDEYSFNLLADITAVDYWPEESPRYHLIYQFHCLNQNVSLTLRIPLQGDDPEIDTIESIYPNANWYERELWDMFGIVFTGHSDLRRILMPTDWEGHPLRKDYPLGYEETQYSFNFDEIDIQKPYAKE